MHQALWKRWTAYLLIASVIVLSFRPVSVQAAEGQAPTLEQIRVALFISNYTTVPSVTLSSASALSVGFRTPAGVMPLFAHAGAVRIALDPSAPHYLDVGTYPSAAEADKQAAALTAAGYKAHTVYHEGGDGLPSISVWIGPAADAAGLEALKAKAQQGGLQFGAIDAAKPYLLEQAGSGAASGSRSFLLNAAGSKAWVTSDRTITVAERANRTYRGAMEVTQYNGKLALVNELPFEAYLYSVVTAEMGGGFPLEALKAQAVAARTYALAQGMKYKIAHISDTTYDQAYYGAGNEAPLAVQAVDATKGEVLMHAGKLAVPFYSSNMGGFTADPSEVWGTPVPYVKVVPSPDQIAESGKLTWDRVVLEDGTVGYIRSDFTRETGQTNEAGFPILTVEGTGVNVRSAPEVDNAKYPPIAQVNQGERLIRIEETIESNPYRWIAGPFAAEELLASINARASVDVAGPLMTLEVTKRGPSGRAVEVKANGHTIQVSTPDALRGTLNGLRSTRFEIEQTGSYTVLGAAGRTAAYPAASGSLYALTGDSAVNVAAQPAKPTGEMFLAVDADGNARLMTKEQTFRFIGYGYGHGLGMSQYGAKDLAEFLGYDYQQILTYYFQDVVIVKG